MTAEGYVEGELFLGKLEEATSVDGLVIKLRREGRGADDTHVRLTGTVRRGGQPVRSGRVGVWWNRRDFNRPNAPIVRGRTAAFPGYEMVHAPVQADGTYSVDDVKIQARGQGQWYLTFVEPGHAETIVGPLVLKLGEHERTFDIDVVEGGSVAGRAIHVPESMAGQVWVIAFNDSIVRRAARVRPDGTFRLDNLPPGRYGLKIGHDVYQDPHIPTLGSGQGPRSPEELAELRKPAEPWQGAVEVTVRSGETVEDVEVDFRPPGPLRDH